MNSGQIMPQYHPPATYRPRYYQQMNEDLQQYPNMGFAGQQDTASFMPPQQQPPAMGYNHNHMPPMNFGMPQQVSPGYPGQPGPFMPPEPVFAGMQPQFMPFPYETEPTLVPFNGTVPPPGFEHNGPCTIQYDNDLNPFPPFFDGSYNQPMLSDSQQFPTIPLQPFPLFIPSQKLPNQRRPKAIAIIDPDTGLDKLSEIYGSSTLQATSDEYVDGI